MGNNGHWRSARWCSVSRLSKMYQTLCEAPVCHLLFDARARVVETMLGKSDTADQALARRKSRSPRH
jgi:hypothetical protein